MKNKSKGDNLEHIDDSFIISGDGLLIPSIINEYMGMGHRCDNPIANIEKKNIQKIKMASKSIDKDTYYLDKAGSLINDKDDGSVVLAINRRNIESFGKVITNANKTSNIIRKMELEGLINSEDTQGVIVGLTIFIYEELEGQDIHEMSTERRNTVKNNLADGCLNPDASYETKKASLEKLKEIISSILWDGTPAQKNNSKTPGSTNTQKFSTSM